MAMPEPTKPASESTQSTAARAGILHRIRAANADLGNATREDDYSAIAHDYQRTSTLSRAAILELFKEQLREYDAVVYESAPSAIRETIATVFAANGQHSAVASSSVPQEWLPENARQIGASNPSIEELNQTEGVVVTCEAAIAHTGTIILKDARMMSLLPDRLLCIVREDQVVETVPEAFARLQPFAASALTFISGPSATADIEMTRIRGVHGPRFLDIVLVHSETA